MQLAYTRRGIAFKRDKHFDPIRAKQNTACTACTYLYIKARERERERERERF